MRRALIVVLLVIVAAIFAPRVVRRFQSRGALVHSHAVGGARYESVSLDPRHFSFRIDHAPAGLRLDGAGAVRMNGGIFEPDLRPTGLLIVDGAELHPLEKGKGRGNFFLEPNGVFYVTASSAGVVATEEFKRDGVLHATQSGPLLVRGGALHPSLSARSEHRFTRNGVGVRQDGTVVFAIARDEVTLFDFATFFRDELDCPNALYLDGAISGLASEGSQVDEDSGPFAVVITATRKEADAATRRR